MRRWPIADKYDRATAISPRARTSSINWPALKDIPDILDELAEVEMHAIQTSGNCIRNVTATISQAPPPTRWIRGPMRDHPQWSTFHPEFSFLPRKFKIAVTGAPNDRAAIQVHDIGLRIVKRGEQVGFEVYVGGGQGRTPMIAALANSCRRPSFCPMSKRSCGSTTAMAAATTSTRRGSRSWCTSLAQKSSRGQVEAEYAAQRPHEKIDLPQAEIDRIHAYFAPPAFDAEDGTEAFEAAKAAEPDFAQWAEVNLHPHKQPGHASVTVSLKPIGGAAGDATDRQMEIVADLAERYAYDDIRVSHAQNLVLPHVPVKHLYAIWQALDAAGLATPNESLITDLIVCPGLDYCNLANARSIPIGQAVQEVFADPKYQREIGRLHINISGCINACGHHHVGHIGILGVDRKGEEFYQISLGGRADEKSAIGAIAGPALKGEDVPGAVKRIINTYMALRTSPDELFIDTLERVGADPFKEALYATA
jgi:sulfite reductase (NADPH) hemoprotein beta-component